MFSVKGQLKALGARPHSTLDPDIKAKTCIRQILAQIFGKSNFRPNLLCSVKYSIAFQINRTCDIDCIYHVLIFLEHKITKNFSISKTFNASAPGVPPLSEFQMKKKSGTQLSFSFSEVFLIVFMCLSFCFGLKSLPFVCNYALKVGKQHQNLNLSVEI